MDRVRMDARTLRYYLRAWPMVFASSGFYSVILVAGLKQIFGVGDAYLKTVGLASFVVFCIFGVYYLAPRLKRIEFGEEERYTSVWGARVGVIVGASIGTVLSVPVIDKIGFLSELPRWLAVSMLFVVFAMAVFVFSHYVWKPGRRH